MVDETAPVAPVKLKDRIENNLVVFFLATLLTGFVAGVGTYQGALKIVDYEAVPSKSYQALKDSSQKPAVVQRWLRVRSVQGLDDVNARVVVLVNGHAYSYPSRTVWSRLRPNLPSEDFALPMDASSYAISFQLLVLDAEGKFQEFGSQQVLSLAPSPSEGMYEVFGYAVGNVGISNGPQRDCAPGLTKGTTICGGPPSPPVRISYEIR